MNQLTYMYKHVRLSLCMSANILLHCREYVSFSFLLSIVVDLAFCFVSYCLFVTRIAFANLIKMCDIMTEMEVNTLFMAICNFILCFSFIISNSRYKL